MKKGSLDASGTLQKATESLTNFEQSEENTKQIILADLDKNTSADEFYQTIAEYPTANSNFDNSNLNLGAASIDLKERESELNEHFRLQEYQLEKSNKEIFKKHINEFCFITSRFSADLNQLALLNKDVVDLGGKSLTELVKNRPISVGLKTNKNWTFEISSDVANGDEQINILADQTFNRAEFVFYPNGLIESIVSENGKTIFDDRSAEGEYESHAEEALQLIIASKAK